MDTPYAHRAATGDWPPLRDDRDNPARLARATAVRASLVADLAEHMFYRDRLYGEQDEILADARAQRDAAWWLAHESDSAATFEAVLDDRWSARLELESHREQTADEREAQVFARFATCALLLAIIAETIIYLFH